MPGDKTKEAAAEQAENQINEEDLDIQPTEDETLDDIRKEVEALGKSATDESETSDEDSAPSEEKPSEEKVEADKEPAKKDAQPAGEEDDFTEAEMAQLSKKAQKRIRSLAEKARKADEELQKLKASPISDRQAALNDVFGKPETESKIESKDSKPIDKLPWEDEEEDDYDDNGMTEEELDRRMQEKADETYRLNRQAERDEEENKQIIDTMRSDAVECEKHYPELDPEKDEYDGDLVDLIETNYLAALKVNKKLRLKDYTDNVMKVIRKRQVASNKATEEIIDDQANNQAIGPTSDSGNRKLNASDLDDMSVDEMRRIIPKA